ncbi:hypothetical protein LEP1GSC062_1723 [Leptospira alexanderi serovar Manhao 3 str. L 60]|uniref:Uncharacterized protein n=1 Tax=Leptospira alexanderi serovar Manhao 3 str. L 60 TaxID=1049759 RepID=V6HVE3_9LEPT|nr:hypothetical protein LEP1GSC062_1723 [Leptospira alexanderi serovar Manhao 3 str. L 60]
MNFINGRFVFAVCLRIAHMPVFLRRIHVLLSNYTSKNKLLSNSIS